MIAVAMAVLPSAGLDDHPPREVSSTERLVLLARRGCRAARDALYERYLPRLRIWARGRLPRRARDGLSTSDLVQDALTNTLARLAHFTPTRDGAFRAYLRLAVDNRIKDEVRRVRRRPFVDALSDAAPLDVDDPSRYLDRWIDYRMTLGRMRPSARRLIVGRLELGYSLKQLAHMDGSTEEAVRKALKRALKRLASLMNG